MGSLVVLAVAQLLAFGSGGVRLGTTTLTTESVDAAAYDPSLELVWWVGGGKLEVLDLRAANDAAASASKTNAKSKKKSKPKAKKSAKSIVIAKGMPEGAFAIDGDSLAQFATADATAPYPILHLTKGKGAIGVSVTAGAPADEIAAAQKSIGKVKIVGAKWLATLSKRKAAKLAAAAADPKVAAITLGAGMASCDHDPKRCGAARPLIGTKLDLVVIADDCSDGCVDRCALYDPKAKKFASPTQASSAWGAVLLTPDTCDGYLVEPGGARYAVGTQLCTLGKTVTCTLDAAWSAVAWIGP